MISAFGPATQAWFSEAFPAPTRVQKEGWPAIFRGDHTLLFAPTGSGKTLAAFLHSIDRLHHGGREEKAGFDVVYISPLKALAVDVERNLHSPILGIHHVAGRTGDSLEPVRVDIRTGDTPQRERQRMSRSPGDILVTTPESLYLMLTSRARETFRHVRTIIIDEIHVLAGTKRGAHLAVSLERLGRLAENEPQRIGLSATQRPLERIARFLGGRRKVTVVDAGEPPHIDLSIRVPVRDMENPPRYLATTSNTHQYPRENTGIGNGTAYPESVDDPLAALEQQVIQAPTEGGIWPSIYPRLLDAIQSHTSTIVFCNSRLLCERLARKLNELAGKELVKAHHGSISHEKRKIVEEELKQGLLPGLVATSSLELGIDMGAVDLVILVESPGAVSSGLQRIGRAGHSVGEVSQGVLFPKYRGDLLESVVVAREMAAGNLEETRPPSNCLDVLAQQLVAILAMEEWNVAELYEFVCKASTYADLSRNLFDAVLEMLVGRYPSDDFADLVPRIIWDRATGVLSPRKNARLTAVLNGGTIPDQGLYGVFLAGEGGKRIGELDEEMVFECRQGETIVLGASTWRIDTITQDRVNVVPAPGEPGRLPFWRGDRRGRPVSLAYALGDFLHAANAKSTKKLRPFISDAAQLDENAVENLARFLEEQREATGGLPSSRSIVVERFRDELGDWRVCIMTPFGTRVHAPWALALRNILSTRAGFDVDMLYTDDGLALRLVDSDTLPDVDQYFPDPDELVSLVKEELAQSALFATRFRENAARALLLPRRRGGQRTPLWLQRRRSQSLLGVAQRYPDFPIVLETYRECLQDVFDLPTTVDVLTRIKDGRISINEVETRRASPFARSLVFQFVANYLYDGDAPTAERRAQALTLDHRLLSELLGQEELRQLLDEESIAAVEMELQYLTSDLSVTSFDQLHDLLRRIGDLSHEEISARATPGLLDKVKLDPRRTCTLQVAGEARVIAIEDAGRYQRALGSVVPPGIASVFLESSDSPLRDLLLRFAKCRGPFVAEDAALRFGLPTEVVKTVLRELTSEGELVFGDIRPRGLQSEWCHVEVLRRCKRRSLATLRKEIEPVDADVYARFLSDWHQVGHSAPGPDALLQSIARLEGCALSYRDLKEHILPSRLPHFQPRDLDSLASAGMIVWRGSGALGSKDGKIRVYRRNRVALLSEASADEPTDALPSTVLERLGRGAAFFSDLQSSLPDEPNIKVLLESIWSLVWSGHITNDTFQPLDGLAARSSRRVSREIQMIGGRWSVFPAVDCGTTEKAHALVMSLLSRYGVVSREAVAAENIRGGFSRCYPVLKAMEEAGKVRRGHFVDGLSGAQFALPGVVDRLRGHRTPDSQDVSILSATDPAQPYGTLFPWPKSLGGTGRPRRAAGALLGLFGGRCAFYLERTGKSATIFTGEAQELQPVLKALTAVRRKRSFRLEKINGLPALSSELAPKLLEIGFSKDPKGLEYEAQP